MKQANTKAFSSFFTKGQRDKQPKCFSDNNVSYQNFFMSVLPSVISLQKVNKFDCRDLYLLNWGFGMLYTSIQM